MKDEAFALRGKNSELEIELGMLEEQLGQWRKAASKEETKKESKNVLKLSRILS